MQREPGKYEETVSINITITDSAVSVRLSQFDLYEDQVNRVETLEITEASDKMLYSNSDHNDLDDQIAQAKYGNKKWGDIEFGDILNSDIDTNSLNPLLLEAYEQGLALKEKWNATEEKDRQSINKISITSKIPARTRNHNILHVSVETESPGNPERFGGLKFSSAESAEFSQDGSLMTENPNPHFAGTIDNDYKGGRFDCTSMKTDHTFNVTSACQAGIGIAPAFIVEMMQVLIYPRKCTKNLLL